MIPTAPIVQVDTREQLALDFTPHGLSVERVALPFGDYGVKGFSGATPGDLLLFAVERKSLSDLCGSLGQQRDRFEREIARMACYRFKGLVIEATEAQVRAHDYRSLLAPSAIFGTLGSWTVNYDLHVRFCGNAVGAASLVSTWAHAFWARRVKESMHLERAYKAA